MVGCLSAAVCLLIGWASAGAGAKHKSHTCAFHWYDGLQWAGGVGTCRGGTKNNFATRRVATPYLSSEHTVAEKTTCGSGDIHHPTPQLSMSIQCSQRSSHPCSSCGDLQGQMVRLHDSTRTHTVLVLIIESMRILRRSSNRCSSCADLRGHTALDRPIQHCTALAAIFESIQSHRSSSVFMGWNCVPFCYRVFADWVGICRGAKQTQHARAVTYMHTYPGH